MVEWLWVLDYEFLGFIAIFAISAIPAININLKLII